MTRTVCDHCGENTLEEPVIVEYTTIGENPLKGATEPIRLCQECRDELFVSIRDAVTAFSRVECLTVVLKEGPR